MNENKKFIKATLIVAFCSLLSRVLGLLRSTLLSSFFGATEGKGLTDCYSASFKLPDIIFNLVVFGIVSIVLIPYFSALIKKDEKEKLNDSVNAFLNFFFLSLLFFIVLGFFFAPFIVKNFLVKGWSDEANILLTVKMTRILFLQMLFMSLSGILSSYLNALEKFTEYSVALLFYNIGIIFGIVVLTPFIGIEGAAWGAVAGSFVQFMIQAVSAYKNGYRYKTTLPDFSPEIRELFIIAAPRIIALGGEQFVKFAIVNIASFLFAGSIFIFENAENFGMVAFGMIAVSVSTTAFPIFSKIFAEGNFNKLVNSLLEKIRFALFFIMPVTAIMMIFRTEIVDLLLGYRKFGPNDIKLTADALFYYMIGIPFFSATIILVKFYYAQKRSVIPMIVTLITVAITTIFSYLLAKNLLVSGLSIARSAGYFFQTLLLVVFIILIYKKERKIIFFDITIIIEIIKIFSISLVMLGLGLFLSGKFSFIYTPKLSYFLKLTVGSVVYSIIYYISMLLLNVSEAKDLKKALLKRKK